MRYLKSWSRKKWVLWYRRRGRTVYLRQFEELETEVQFTKIWESAGFLRRVSVGTHYTTIHDVDDGFEGKNGACREFSVPREDPDSEIIAWIGEHQNWFSSSSLNSLLL